MWRHRVSLCLALLLWIETTVCILFSAGLDLGTSGVRIAVVNQESLASAYEASLSWSADAGGVPEEWENAVKHLLGGIPKELRRDLARICVSGTSASCLLLTPSSTGCLVTRGPRMYNFNVVTEGGAAGAAAMEELRNIAPPAHTTLSGTSALAKLLAWHLESPLLPAERLAHQADFISLFLRQNTDQSSAGITVTSDWNNALKAGYDVQKLCWPDWLGGSAAGSAAAAALPAEVVRPGAATGKLAAAVAAQLDLPADCDVVAGTTDSVAAFIAGGVTEPGCAVTSLGSTLAIKLLSEAFVEDSSRGVYSHRLGTESAPLWLVGGASNVGCKVLRQEGFSPQELRELSLQIDPTRLSALGDVYYPLPAGAGGERFPVNDPFKAAVLEPKPASRAEYLQAILKAIARVEAEGFASLSDLGASKLRKVLTAGGGAANPTWTAMRQHILGVPVERAANADAAYGAALLGLLEAESR